MILAVVSCWAYRDAWGPFVALLRRFWRDHPQAVLITDKGCGRIDGHRVLEFGERPWSDIVSTFAFSAYLNKSAILLMQEDFFLTGPVNAGLIYHGLGQLEMQGAGLVRLYPCPGGTEDYGDPYFATVPRETPYRISCQASIWNPEYLGVIASQCDTPADFELRGSQIADSLPEPVLAFKREVQPWPLEYLCSGISRGRWNPDAKMLFRQHGIEADYSLRP